ncbi:MAG TPA: DUF5691 domain-containing protein [Gemmatimonadaceae bacterium]|nr:DUF5691 domain-containing protein [Gemmatimonadaceae bacterium]
MTTDARLEVIARAALLGTERGAACSWQASDAPAAVAPYLARLDVADAEGALLSAAALLGAYAAAGRLPSPCAATSAPAAPALPDESDAPVAAPGPSRLLATMLAGVHAEALPEWLARAADRGWRVPPVSLPALLGLGTATPALRAPLSAVLGARGRWLAAQHDEWRWGAHDTAPPEGDALATAWQTGTPAERAALLERVRRVDASRGRALLESTWDEEPPTQRAALLPHLAIALGLADEPFLERALDDRRQEVRRAAAALLAGLPGSALVGRMAQRARAALRYERGGVLRRDRLHVEPPAACDASMARDGVEKAPPAGMGERAWWLAQLLAAVPPASWTTEWGVEPTNLVRVATGTDWASPLLDGWGAAAVRFGDAPWAEALLAAAPVGRQASRLAPSRAALLDVIPPARRETIVAPALRDRAFDADVVELVIACTHPWSEPFARAVLDWLRQRAGRPATARPDASDWQLREVLPRLASFVPPSLAATAAERWPADDEHARAWARPVERFLSLLTFRHEIAEEFAR